MRKTVLVAGLLVAAALLAAPAPVRASGLSFRLEVKYVGTWHIQPNGDIKVVRTFTVPAMMYTNWKSNNLHMKEMRSFHPAICPVQCDDLAFKWDDVKRTLTLTMTVRGLVANKGDHWEAEMTPGLQFSNIDVAEKKAYFHVSVVNPRVTINGQDVVVFPPEATNIKNIDGRALRFDMPEIPAETGGGTALWWGLFGLTFVGGVGLIGVSFRGRK